MWGLQYPVTLTFTTVINYQIVCMYVFDCTIWGIHPLGKPAELTAQYLILNLGAICEFAQFINCRVLLFSPPFITLT